MQFSLISKEFDSSAKKLWKIIPVREKEQRARFFLSLRAPFKLV